MKRGDTVVCVDNAGMEHRLTEGETYKILHKYDHYFVNVQDFLDNRTLMTEEEAMEYLRKNGGGTLYKKVLTMRIKTKTVEEIEKHG
jgi:hypothetical protein